MIVLFWMAGAMDVLCMLVAAWQDDDQERMLWLVRAAHAMTLAIVVLVVMIARQFELF